MSETVSPAPVLSPRGGVGEVWVGVGLPLRALRLIFTTPKLLALSALSAALTAATLAGLVIGLWLETGHWASALVTGDGVASSLGWGALRVALFIVSFTVGALTVPNVVLAPLQDPLSETTEQRCGDFTPAPFTLGGFARGLWMSLWHTAWRLVLTLAGLAVLAPLNLVPVAGSVLWVVGSWTWGAFLVSAEQLSNPMARHLRPFGEVLKALRARKSLALGFGAALEVLLWVPVLNTFLMPVAVVAGTLLFRSLRQAGVVAGTKA